jgi:hypothetical protein
MNDRADPATRRPRACCPDHRATPTPSQRMVRGLAITSSVMGSREASIRHPAGEGPTLRGMSRDRDAIPPLRGMTQAGFRHRFVRSPLKRHRTSGLLQGGCSPRLTQSRERPTIGPPARDLPVGGPSGAGVAAQASGPSSGELSRVPVLTRRGMAGARSRLPWMDPSILGRGACAPRQPHDAVGRTHLSTRRRPRGYERAGHSGLEPR